MFILLTKYEKFFYIENNDSWESSGEIQLSSVPPVRGNPLFSARYEMIARGRPKGMSLLIYEGISSDLEVLGSSISLQTTSLN
jgi:hypothetical protein